MHDFSKKTEIYLHNTKKVRTFALAFENYLSKQLKNNPNLIEYYFFKYIYRGVEQLVARQAHNLEVTRSSRVSATIGLKQLDLQVFQTFVIYRSDRSRT